jgi:hypothetical protein
VNTRLLSEPSFAFGTAHATLGEEIDRSTHEHVKQYATTRSHKAHQYYEHDGIAGRESVQQVQTQQAHDVFLGLPFEVNW